MPSVGQGSAEQTLENLSATALEESMVKNTEGYMQYFKDLKAPSMNYSSKFNETHSLTTEVGSSVNMALAYTVNAFYAKIGETSCNANNVGITSTVTCKITTCVYNNCEKTCNNFAPIADGMDYTFYIKDGCFANAATDSGKSDADFVENGSKRKFFI